ncbi:MAG: 16S rRNA (cytidine(1402)-2'-O)-methyltransferase, partial [Chloroflexota bacterium]|nr:16S rRNA (cytidine(1402)-2'-O)-methyltransferase [Chloroflexota bacterium]
HEEVWRGSVSGALEYFDAPRGEFVLVVAGAGDSGDPGQPTDPEVAREQLLSLRQAGSRARDAVGQVTAATGLPRSEVYRLWLETAGDSAG